MGALQTDTAREAAAGERVVSLHQRYAQSVRRYCLRRLRLHEDAEDATQVVFLTAYRCLLEGVEPIADAAWLFKIAENVVLQRRRSMTRRARVEYAVDVDRLADSVAAPALDGASKLDGVREALAAMPESQRQAIVLREWRGLSYREVARELGVSDTAVEALIFRARRGLVRRLEVRNRLTRNGRRFGFWLPAEPLKLALGGGGVGAKVVLGAASIAVVATTARPVARLALTAATTRVASPHAVSRTASRPRYVHHRRPAHAPAAAATPRGGSSAPAHTSAATPSAPAASPVPDAAPRGRGSVAAPAPVPAPPSALASASASAPAADASPAQPTVATAGPTVAPDGGIPAPVADTAQGTDAGPAPDAAPDSTTSPASPTVNPAGKTPPAVGRTPDAVPPGLDRAGAQSDPPGRAGGPPPGHADDSGNGNGNGNRNAYGRQAVAETLSAAPATGADPDPAVPGPPADPESAQPDAADAADADTGDAGAHGHGHGHARAS